MKRDKIKPTIEHPISFYYPTSDDWSPSFGQLPSYRCPDKIGFLCNVHISVYLYYNPDKVGTMPDGLIRIVVSGADDTMMGKETRCPISEYEAKLKEIRHWCDHLLPNPLTMDWLKTQGFRFE
jgi:hypothetical protein